MLAVLTAFVSSLALVTSARAHEVQPAIMDLELSPEELTINLAWILEAPLAGLDLDGIEDTNEAEGSDLYDQLRALKPSEIANQLRQSWPEISSKIKVQSGDVRIPLELVDVAVPDVVNIELARVSDLSLRATLPAGDQPLVIGWDASFGTLVVRQRNVEGGYAGYLTSGQMSYPIPRNGAQTETAGEAFVSYIGVGFDHIVPLGLDHILFVLGLFFLSLQLRPLFWQISAFTLAHTVTLALGAMDLVRLPPQLVEPLIAASIAYVGIENLFSQRLSPWRPFVIFLFGLLHGLGFASVLVDFGLGESHFFPKLIGFNVGVELGQLAVIGAAWLAFGLLFGKADWYHRRIAVPVSLAISIIAMFWVFERIGFYTAGSGFWQPFIVLLDGSADPVWALGVSAVVAAAVTGFAMSQFSSLKSRDAIGFVTSFGMFVALIALFTGAYWLLALASVLIWIGALFIQSNFGVQGNNVV